MTLCTPPLLTQQSPGSLCNRNIETLPLVSQIFPWLMFVLTLVLTIGAAHFAQLHAERTAHRDTVAHADAISQIIGGRLQAVEQLLHNSASLLGLVPDVRRKTWHAYIASLDFGVRYRDLLGLGYIQWVPSSALGEHSMRIQDDDGSNYRIRPAGNRAAYAPVVYTEPSTTPSLRSIGYDMLSDPVYLDALVQARDTGAVTLSRPVPMIRQSGKPAQPGVMMFMPVYRNGMPRADVNERRAALLGFVYGALRLADVAEIHFGGSLSNADIALLDLAEPSGGGGMLFTSDAAGKYAGHDDDPAFTVTRDIPAYGQTWRVRLASQPYADVVSPRLNVLPILATGTLIGLMLFYVGWSFATSRRRALVLAGEMTAALRASENRLRLIADNIPALVAYTSKDRRFVFGNRRYQDAFGADQEKIAGMSTADVIGAEAYAQSQHHIESVLAGQYTQFERTVHYNGARRWERVSYAPDIQSDGTVAGFFSLVEDITELKQIQATLANSELHLRTITDNLPAMIAYIDADMRYRFCNSRYRAIVGYENRPLLGLTVEEAVNPETYRHVQAHMRSALSGNAVTFDRHVMEIAPPRHLHYDYIPDRTPDGRVLGFYSMIIDITERKEAELRQAASEKMLRGVTDHLPALVSFIDRDERFLFNNAPYEQWLNRSLSDITGQRVADVYSPEEYAIFSPVVKSAMNGTLAERDFELSMNGEKRFYRATSVPQFNEQGEVYGVCSMTTDITAIKQVEIRLSEMARTDSLTGLPNRNAINEKLLEAMARSRRNGTRMAAMFLDLDRFKSINDTYGHYCGDRVLVEFARRLQASVRATDTVGRLAGDEFVIIAEGLRHEDESVFIAEKIVQAMGMPISIDGVRHQVSTSIGIAVRQEEETDAQRLLKRADEALYQAKAAGRNRFVSLNLPT